MPNRGVDHADSGDLEICTILSIEQDWTIVCVIRVENLSACKAIIPCLPIAIESARTKYLNISTTPFPESDGFLERMVEVVALPVSDVVRELEN